jgi:hypothetical protein
MAGASHYVRSHSSINSSLIAQRLNRCTGQSIYGEESDDLPETFPAVKLP